MRSTALALMAGLLSGCLAAAPPQPMFKGDQNNPYVVEIPWDTENSCKVNKGAFKEDPAGLCPPPDSGLCLQRDKFIEWQSVNPADAKFEIFFDPLQPTPLKSANGKLKRKIDANAPIASYKYSIVRDGCDPTAENTFDPHIRIVE